MDLRENFVNGGKRVKRTHVRNKKCHIYELNIILCMNDHQFNKMDTKPTEDLKFDMFVTKNKQKSIRVAHFRCFYGVFTLISHSKE